MTILNRTNHLLIPAICIFLALSIAGCCTFNIVKASAYPNVGQVTNGTCWIGDNWMIGSQSYFSCTFNDAELSGTFTLECLNATAGEPWPQYAPYSASIVDINYETGATTYFITITPEGATDGVTKNWVYFPSIGKYLECLVGTQRVGGSLTVTKDYTGPIKIQKQSSQPEFTNNNAYYSLQNAQFGLYKDEACTELLEMLNTNCYGFAQSEKEYVVGKYYIKELKEPRGFVLNNQVYSVALDSKDGVCCNIVDDIETSSIEVTKVDEESNEAIANTEFSLYWMAAYIMDEIPGYIYMPDESNENWQLISQQITDEMGLCNFCNLPYGVYKLVESKPNPMYMSAREKMMQEIPETNPSSQASTYFWLNEDSPEVNQQLISNKALSIGCNINKNTISITSAAFKSLDEDYNLIINNVNSERFLYSTSFESTSNCRADEFTVIDLIDTSNSEQLNLVDLWSPVTQGDTDGLYNIWYQTNLCEESTQYSSANASASNPENPNTTQGARVTSTTGWKLLAVDIACNERIHFEEADFELEDGEWVTRLMYEYGSVEKGFTTCDQESTGGSAVYAVLCNKNLNTKDKDGNTTSIDSTANCAIYRNTNFVNEGECLQANLVLYDYASDDTETTVIDSFMATLTGSQPSNKNRTYGQAGLPLTGDRLLHLWQMLWCKN